MTASKTEKHISSSAACTQQIEIKLAVSLPAFELRDS